MVVVVGEGVMGGRLLRLLLWFWVSLWIVLLMEFAKAACCAGVQWAQLASSVKIAIRM